MGLILLILLIVFLFGGEVPGYRSGYYGPRGFGGLFGLVVLILIVYLLFGGGFHNHFMY